MSTAAQILANQQNAKLSSGPKTESGKAAVRLNAVKTGLTGQIVLLPSDDLAAYQAHVDRHFTRYKPTNEEEHTLVQFLADTEWRLLRIAPLEAAIWAQGRRDLAEMHAAEPDPVLREGLIKLAIMNTYRKDLNNLALQERRLRNHYKADLDRLQTLQKERPEKAFAKCRKMLEAGQVLQRFKDANQPWNPAELGFDFSIEEIEYYNAEAFRTRSISGRAPEVDMVLAKLHQAKKAGQAA